MSVDGLLRTKRNRRNHGDDPGNRRRGGSPGKDKDTNGQQHCTNQGYVEASFRRGKSVILIGDPRVPRVLVKSGLHIR
jgi:hypothetical protein